MIQALRMAGPNPTRANVIKQLRSIKNYTANGLLPNPIKYSTIFGHDPAKQCVWILRATKERLRDQPPDRLRNGSSVNLRPATLPSA
jgi:hypothetical protein